MPYYTFETRSDTTLSRYVRLSPLYRSKNMIMIEKIIDGYFNKETLDKIQQNTVIPLYELVTPIENVRTQKIPRPQNSFVIYRRNIQAKIASSIASDNSIGKLDNVSKLAGKQWKKEPKEIRELYGLIAECAKKVHDFLYPGYVYHPRRNATTNIPMRIISNHRGNIPQVVRWKNKLVTNRRQGDLPSSSSTFSTFRQTSCLPTPTISRSKQLSDTYNITIPSSLHYSMSSCYYNDVSSQNQLSQTSNSSSSNSSSSNSSPNSQFPFTHSQSQTDLFSEPCDNTIPSLSQLALQFPSLPKTEKNIDSLLPLTSYDRKVCHLLNTHNKYF
ncbi:MATA-HMG [Gigaspora margarita]|uniref:MATA-HMG n=1 Tax=Gigaspora margarita TaxID=4874 RepID=A0A8H4ASG0_GIGMA|nr:MATA-HMG [Gigaspora margarita]